ncbi:unnamed protein product [Owenia fusiformis]|nr:unnamed protein product [Owenia fusiformis]
MLFNIGYKEALSLRDGNQAPLCLILHDVDLLLENDRLIYDCSQYPTHFSLAIDKFQYSLPYDWLFGGVVALLGDQFEETNGFGNLFFGWGGEDDDFRERLLYAGLFPVQHDNASISRYSMITHGESKSKNEDRQNMVATGYERYHCDGLNSMEYAVNNTQYKEHFIIISITLPLNLKRSSVCQSCFSENKDLKIDSEISDNGTMNEPPDICL